MLTGPQFMFVVRKPKSIIDSPGLICNGFLGMILCNVLLDAPSQFYFSLMLHNIMNVLYRRLICLDMCFLDYD